MNILVFSGLYDHKLISKLAPLLALESVKRIFLLRNTPLDIPCVMSFSPPVFMNFPGMRELYKIVKGISLCLTGKIDLVIGIYFRPHGWFSSFLGKSFGIPYILDFIGNDVDFFCRFSFIFKGMLRGARWIGVRGSNSRFRLGRYIKDRSRLFVHHNVFSFPIRPRSYPSLKNIDILCIADFSRVKRMDLFLKTCARLKKTFPSLKAVMLGGGNRRSWYDRLRKRLGLEYNVRFAGKVKDVYSFLKRSRVFMLTSEAEGLPMALIEAMGTGIPCVVPDVGDISDIAKDGQNALVVSSRDPREFAAKVECLLANDAYSACLSREAIKTILNMRKEFSLPFNRDIWERLLREING